jgi:hypothetical protein
VRTAVASGAAGSRMCTGWKQRARPASRSMRRRNSCVVDAAMQRSSPRASAGRSSDEMSGPPAVAPPAEIGAPVATAVCSSSTNKMIGVSEAATSAITLLSLASNSPRSFAPASSSAMSSASTLAACMHVVLCWCAQLPAAADERCCGLATQHTVPHAASKVLRCSTEACTHGATLQRGAPLRL